MFFKQAWQTRVTNSGRKPKRGREGAQKGGEGTEGVNSYRKAWGEIWVIEDVMLGGREGRGGRYQGSTVWKEDGGNENGSGDGGKRKLGRGGKEGLRGRRGIGD